MKITNDTCHPGSRKAAIRDPFCRNRLVSQWIPAFAGMTVFLVILIFSYPAYAEMTDYPQVRLRSLDKITARTMTFDARVGTTIKFGSIYIKTQACRKPDLQERPEAAAFLQIWEITPQEESKWIFSGWMFASSPALSAMDHPIYDVWVIDCLADEVPKTPFPLPLRERGHAEGVGGRVRGYNLTGPSA